MAMIGKRASIGELLVAHLANHRLVAMRSHVSLQARLVVKVLAALGARVALLARVIPGVLDQCLAIATLFAAQHARVGLQLVRMARVQMPFDSLLLVKANTAQDASANVGSNHKLDLVARVCPTHLNGGKRA